MKILLFAIFLLFSGGAWGQSIVYAGFECKLSHDNSGFLPDFSSPPVTSRITLTHDIGGVLDLEISGGMPFFEDDANTSCIMKGFDVKEFDSDSPASAVKETSAKAIGIFNGTQLTVIFNTLGSTRSANAFLNSNTVRMSSSFFLVELSVHIFDYNAETNSFTLNRLTGSGGNISTSGELNLLSLAAKFNEYLEPAMQPLLFQTKTPGVNIEYFFD